MTIRVERAAYDPESGFLYYVIFKPGLELGVDDVLSREEVEVAVSLTETGEIADMTFIVPKQLRTPASLAFVCAEGQAAYIEPRVFVAVRGASGDTVASIPGELEVDLAGRIVGMVMRWRPDAIPD